MRTAALLVSVPAMLIAAAVSGRQEPTEKALTAHESGITDIALTPDGQKLYSCDLDGMIVEWDLRTDKRVRSWRADPDELYSLDSKGGVVAAVGLGGTASFSRSGRVERTVKLPRGWALTVALSPDGSRAAAIGMDGYLQLIDVRSGKVEKQVRTRTWPSAMAWMPDGKGIAIAWADITVWNIELGQPIMTLKGHTSSVRSFALSPDGDQLLSASLDKTARVWDLKSGTDVLKLVQNGFVQYQSNESSILQKIEMPLLAAAFSPDGRTFATAGADRLVRIWDSQTGMLKQTFQGHRMSITGLCYTPDGGRIISGSLDRTVRLFALR